MAKKKIVITPNADGALEKLDHLYRTKRNVKWYDHSEK